MSISHFAFCWVLVIGSGLAQEAPEKAVRDIKDVQLGMSRDHVLASLSEKYDLTRIDDPQSQSALAGDEYWMASPKPNAVRNHDLDIDSGGAVRFWKGKASSIEMDLYASRQGESTRFAEQLFWLVYNRAELPVTPVLGTQTGKQARFAHLQQLVQNLIGNAIIEIHRQEVDQGQAWLVSKMVLCEARLTGSS